MNLYRPNHSYLIMSIESIAVAAGSGGLAGSLLTMLIGQLREKKRLRTLRFRIYMQVAYELTIYRAYLDKFIAGSDTAMIESHTSSAIVKEGEKIASSFEYPSMPDELKLLSFEPPLHAQIQDVYREIASIALHRVSRHVGMGEAGSFAYGKSYLQQLSKKIYDLVENIRLSQMTLFGYKRIRP